MPSSISFWMKRLSCCIPRKKAYSFTILWPDVKGVSLQEGEKTMVRQLLLSAINVLAAGVFVAPYAYWSKKKPSSADPAE